MNSSLLQLLKDSKNGDNNATAEIYNKFLPLIKKLSRKLDYEEAETDIIIQLLEIIKNIKVNNLKIADDGAAVNYINISLKNNYNSLLKNLIRKKTKTISLNDQIIPVNDNYNDSDISDLYKVMKNINTLQKKIIIGKVVYKYTDSELAKILHVSRQTIVNNKNNALRILKNQYMKIKV